MKRIIKYLIISAVCLVAADFAVGIVANKLRQGTKGGDTKRSEYINHDSRDSIIVFGSSRAMHHYIPSIIEDSLGLSAYNAGADGNGIILAYMQLHTLLQYHTPKMIIYDVYPPFDFNKNDNNKYLSRQRYFYGEKPEADSVFWRISPTERVKMLSNMYRYNSSLVQLMADYISPQQSDIKGYRPQYGSPDFIVEKDFDFDLDSVKLYYFNRFIDLCRAHNIDLRLVFSPRYFGNYTPTYGYQFAQETAAKKGLQITDLRRIPPFNTDKSLFKDSQHLNDSGAQIFTRLLIKHLP